MLYPSLNEVKALAENYNTIPVFYTFPADHRTPVGIFKALSAGRENAFILESVGNDSQWARYSFIGSDPRLTLRSEAGVSRAGRDGSFCVMPGDPFTSVRELLSQYRSPKMADYPSFTGGLIGYFAYDCVRFAEKKLVNVPEDDIRMPDCEMFLYDELVAYDHLSSNAVVIQNIHTGADIAAQYQAAEIRAAEIAALIDRVPCAGPFRDDEPRTEAVSNLDEDDFISIVKAAKEYIRNGDIFQVVLSRRFSISDPPDSFEVYRRLRASNPSPYLYYFKTPEYAIAGASPEMLAKVEDGRVYTRPIAGTIRRGATPVEDAQLEEKLRNDAKERAEHTMLVDLGRNDIGRVSRFGTVRVDDFMHIERYSQVMHLVSDVSGQLREDCDALDVLASVLPAGTLSGAPKVRAMEIIDELENRRRGLYGGTVGFFGFNGDMNTCIAIRTVLFRNGKAYVQAGAGIVADSDPEKEFAETAYKAKAVLRAIEEARV